MPILTFQGIDTAAVQALSDSLLKELSALTGTPIQSFSVTRLPAERFSAGYAPAQTPFIEMRWFPRDLSVCDKAEALIRSTMAAYGYTDVTVYISTMDPRTYYVRGKHS